jgi:hypothetical protein
MVLPMIEPADVVDQMDRARDLGTSSWHRQLEDWVRDLIRPRIDGGAS